MVRQPQPLKRAGTYNNSKPVLSVPHLSWKYTALSRHTLSRDPHARGRGRNTPSLVRAIQQTGLDPVSVLSFTASQEDTNWRCQNSVAESCSTSINPITKVVIELSHEEGLHELAERLQRYVRDKCINPPTCNTVLTLLGARNLRSKTPTQ